MVLDMSYENADADTAAAVLNAVFDGSCGDHNCCPPANTDCCGDEPEEYPAQVKAVQWSTSNGKIFVPSGKSAALLPPGVYEISHSDQIGLFFEKIPVSTNGLIRFPDSTFDEVIIEIEKFWDREKIFKEYNVPFRRGIMLFGNPGGGKTSLVKFVSNDVIARGGIVVRFNRPGLFIDGMRYFREIQPDTPVVVVMEDIDDILEQFGESECLNILDGVNRIDKACYLATTNYPQLLGPRIINRPSRFDKRFKIGLPNPESRAVYLEYIIGGKGKAKELAIDIDQWVDDTDKFSIAHLKELFTAVVILGDEYKVALDILREMNEDEPDDGTGDLKGSIGFFPTPKAIENGKRKSKYNRGG
jgi:hypothetical protein